jgi:malate synthase
MTADSSADIQTDYSKIVTNGVAIEDPDVVEYVTSRDEDPADALRLALRVGVSTLRLSDTTEEAEYVRHEFDKMNRELQDEIDELREELDGWFDEDDGDFGSLIDDHFGDEGSLVQDVFDPSSDDTPLGQLRDDLEDRLDDIQETVVRQDEREAVEQETTIKGEHFEDDLQTLLPEVTQKTDEVQRTGDDHGQLDDRFVGDFVVTLGETGQQIVIEAKDVATIGKPEIKRQLEQGIENRGADYGVLILKNEDAASDFLGAFREFDQEMLYVAISDEDTDTYDQRLLNLALEWARMRTLSSQLDTDDDLDPDVIRSKISEAEDALGRFTDIRTKCTNIKNARESIESELEDIETDIEEQLDAITDELRVANRE